MTHQANWRKARVHSVRDLSVDTRLIEIVPEGRLQAAAPGGHIDVAVQINGRPATRSYSTLDDGASSAYRIAVKRTQDSRGGSLWMHSLLEGAQLSISGPSNHFELSRIAPQYLLIAGGIGITPIHSMAMALARTNANFSVLYACRTRNDGILADDLHKKIGDRLTLFAADEGQRIDISQAIGSLAADGELYVCGPISMLDEARSVWAQSDRPVDKLRIETFANSGRYPNAPFTVHLPNIDCSVDVAKNQTILEALEQAGIAAMYDCRRGECGLCALGVISVDGVIDHRDVFFSDEEKAAGQKLCACVSRISGQSITVDNGERR